MAKEVQAPPTPLNWLRVGREVGAREWPPRRHRCRPLPHPCGFCRRALRALGRTEEREAGSAGSPRCRAAAARLGPLRHGQLSGHLGPATDTSDRAASRQVAGGLRPFPASLSFSAVLGGSLAPRQQRLHPGAATGCGARAGSQCGRGGGSALLGLNEGRFSGLRHGGDPGTAPARGGLTLAWAQESAGLCLL